MPAFLSAGFPYLSLIRCRSINPCFFTPEPTMPLEITYLGHSGFLFVDGDHRVAVDPFLTGNPVAQHTPEQITCQFIALTHGHADHVGDSIAIAQRNGATIIGVFEVCNWAAEQGVQRVEPGNPGGRINTPFGFVAFTQAFHSSSYQGRYMGQPTGLILHFAGAGQTVYHCGDTALFSDMKLIGELYQPTVACIPIGDRFTMGPQQASLAAQFIGAPYAIPIHHNTWPPIAVDVNRFAPQGVQVKAMQPGAVWSLG
jgi:L-ascorbate metabolism protein UlaG (beta-lactamase superfamily)